MTKAAHKTNTQMDWTVQHVLYYRPFKCPHSLNSCICFHKGTIAAHKYGEEFWRCPFLLKFDEDLDCICIDCRASKADPWDAELQARNRSLLRVVITWRQFSRVCAYRQHTINIRPDTCTFPFAKPNKQCNKTNCRLYVPDAARHDERTGG